LMASREASEGDELRFEVVSIVDGSRVNFDGLAETIHAARLKCRPEGFSSTSLANESGQESTRGSSRNSLSERIRLARERATR